MRGEYMSEKFDGIQARLVNGRLFSRNGALIPAPQWWLDRCPAGKMLIGELWLGYGTDCNDAQKLLKEGADWSSAVLMVFGGEPYEPRDIHRNVVWLAQQIEVVSTEQLLAFYEGTLLRGGEGVIIRASTGNITKLKPRADAEAEVIGYTRGSNQTTGPIVEGINGPISSLLVKGLNGPAKGITFGLSAGLTQKLRDNPPKLGALVKYSYAGITKQNKPREAAYRGERDERTMMLEYELPPKK